MTKIFCFLLLASTCLFAQRGDGARAKHRVVVEINSGDHETWSVALKNIANLQQSFGPSHVQVEVVALGKGIDLVLAGTSEFTERLGALSARGITFAACQNTMKQRHLAKQDLLPFVITVDSGVAEIVRKQEDGWSYLKTGS